MDLVEALERGGLSRQPLKPVYVTVTEPVVPVISSQPTAPANPNVGDVWWNTTGGANIPSRWSGSAWVDLSQPVGIHTFGPQTNTPTALAAGDIWYDSNTVPPLTKRWSGSAWVTIAGNKVTTSNTAPTTPIAGDTWVDTTGGTNVFKVWSGSAWVVQGSGNIIWTQSTTPATPRTGDLWYDTSTTPTTLRVYGGSAWQALVGTGILTAAMMATGTLSAGNITAGTFVAGVGYVGDLTASQIKTGSIDAARVTAANLTSGTINATTMTVTGINASAITAGTLDAARVTTANLTAGTIDATNMTVSNIAAGAIRAGSLQAGVVYTGNLTASQINAGTLDAARIGAGTITANKLTVSGGVGAALNADPTCMDVTAWVCVQAPVLISGGAGPAGFTFIYSNGLTNQHVFSLPFAVDSTKQYRGRCWARGATGSNGAFYLRLYWFDYYDNELGISEASGNGSPLSNSGWSEHTVSAVTPLPGAVRGRVCVVLNYAGTAGNHYAQDIRCEEVLPKGLIRSDAFETTDYAAGVTNRDQPSEATTQGSRIKVSASGVPGIITSPAGIRIGTKTLSQTWLDQSRMGAVRIYSNAGSSAVYVNWSVGVPQLVEPSGTIDGQGNVSVKTGWASMNVIVTVAAMLNNVPMFLVPLYYATYPDGTLQMQFCNGAGTIYREEMTTWAWQAQISFTAQGSSFA